MQKNNKLERLNPLNDFAFQKGMGEKGDEPQLKGFVSAVLASTGKADIISIDIMENKEVLPDTISGKTVRFDVLASAVVKLRGPHGIELEVQLRNEYNMALRTLYYWCLQFAGALDAGQDYSMLRPVVAINILGFGMFDNDRYPRYHTVFHLREDEYPDLVLTEACEIHFLDLVKFRVYRRGLEAAGKFTLEDSLDRWMVYLDASSPVGLVEECLRMDGGIRGYHEQLGVIGRTPELRRAYDAREKGERDWLSCMNGSRQEGRLEVLSEISRLLQQNVSIEELRRRYGTI
jgi:predicted transposase/invertase (TIGR01784 family)